MNIYSHIKKYLSMTKKINELGDGDIKLAHTFRKKSDQLFRLIMAELYEIEYKYNFIIEQNCRKKKTISSMKYVDVDFDKYTGNPSSLK